MCIYIYIYTHIERHLSLYIYIYIHTRPRGARQPGRGRCGARHGLYSSLVYSSLL